MFVLSKLCNVIIFRNIKTYAFKIFTFPIETFILFKYDYHTFEANSELIKPFSICSKITSLIKYFLFPEKYDVKEN